MKPLALLSLVLLSASCSYRPEPYPRKRPPQRPVPPDATTGAVPGPGTETGTFEPAPGNPPPPPAYDETRPDPSQDSPPSEPKPRPDYPVARSTANPNQVISPFAPYNVIDVEGFESGALAKDPSNGKIFRVP